MRISPPSRARRSPLSSILVFLVAGFVLLSDRPATTAEEVETWYATAYVQSPLGLRVIHYWSKGSWMRAETVVGGQPIVTIVRGKHYYTWNELSGQAARIERAKGAIARDRTRRRNFGYEFQDLKADGAEKVEETLVQGETVEVWRVTDKTSRRTLRVTAAGDRVPLRLEAYVRGGGETVSTDYMNWQKGLAVPDRFFEAPGWPNFEKLDHSEYGEQARKRSIAPVLYPDLLFDPAGD